MKKQNYFYYFFHWHYSIIFYCSGWNEGRELKKFQMLNWEDGGIKTKGQHFAITKKQGIKFDPRSWPEMDTIQKIR